jgi:hypothetical protein
MIRPPADQARPIQPLAEVVSYDDLIAALRARKDELDISFLELDFIGGLTSGHSSKLLAPVRPYMKCLGPVSLGLILGALGLRLLVVEDPEALARVRGRYVKRYVSRHKHQQAAAAAS